jgi:hypothetical protein
MPTIQPRMREDLETFAPERIKRLPVDPVRGMPVPWFVAWVEGKPEFRVADGRKYARAVRENLCWVCGERLGRYRAFVIGPMCTINRISAEPPNHRECAEFSLRACPFLTRPAMERRDTDLADGTPIGDSGCTGGGVMLKHNPGVTVLYIPMTFEVRPDGHGGRLFHLGEPLWSEWWTLARHATPAEAAAGFDLGVTRLRQLAEGNGAAALREFDRLHKRARQLLPGN